MAKFSFKTGQLSLDDLHALATTHQDVALDPGCWPGVDAAYTHVSAIAGGDDLVYGVNTGFGSLAKTRIETDDLRELQRRLLRSHAAGTGRLLDDDVVGLVLVLKANSLARGHSGVQRAVIDGLLAFHNARVYPCVPSQGSVGASGDLAPLAHLSLPLIGEGEVRMDGTVHSAAEGLKRAGLAPIDLGPKEGLALINGTQVSTALALKGLFNCWAVFSAALVAGAMSVDAAQGSDSPLLPVVQDVRGQPGQSTVAATLRDLMAGSEIRAAHATCDRVQDPYSLSCQPQVMGSCLDLLRFAAAVVGREANAVTDNPLVFADDGEVLSAGNFHAQPIAHASDILALALAEPGSMSERRVQLLTNTTMSGLPAFLIPDPGLNSGFMAAQIVAAALAAENKVLATPASTGSLPTTADQEDHVSMATHAARRLGDMTRNAAAVVAIELLAAAQGIDLRRPLKTSPRLAEAHAAVRKLSPFMDIDRSISGDIDALVDFILAGGFEGLAPVDLSAG